MTVIPADEVKRRAWTAISAADLGTAWSDIILEPSDALSVEEKKNYLLDMVGFLFGVMVFTTKTLMTAANELKADDVEPLTYQELVAILQRGTEIET